MRVVSPVLLALCAFGASAGTVDVSLVNPSRYTDAGAFTQEEAQNVDAIGRHLQALGQRWLPADHVMKVELLDVDLAGSVRGISRGITPVRTVRGMADFPRVKLRYTLQAPGQPVRTAEEDISDINYARGITGARAQEPLYYEKRMLENWFRQRFAPA